jgi:hypothetical protein
MLPACRSPFRVVPTLCCGAALLVLPLARLRASALVQCAAAWAETHLHAPLQTLRMGPCLRQHLDHRWRGRDSRADFTWHRLQVSPGDSAISFSLNHGGEAVSFAEDAHGPHAQHDAPSVSVVNGDRRAGNLDLQRQLPYSRYGLWPCDVWHPSGRTDSGPQLKNRYKSSLWRRRFVRKKKISRNGPSGSHAREAGPGGPPRAAHAEL